MYICVCNAVSERQLQQAVSDGLRSIRALRLHFGFSSCCGRCTGCMRGYLNRHPRSAADATIPGDPPCKAKTKSYSYSTRR
ncbi:MAG TPA: (2Fe-2S)-binding protein [Gammaproteobacteria bacterium]|nr:(2Fe-2S)-binding protein [Gammaproteobacteria bacterium]